MFYKVNKFIAIVFIGVIYIFSISINVSFFQNYHIDFQILNSKNGFITYITDSFNSSVQTSLIRNILKKQIVRIFVITKYLCSNKINNRVYIGKNWWMFYLSDSSKEDFSGNKYFSKEQKENFKNKIEQINNYLQQKQIKFILIIVPNKEQIYYYNMPCTIQKHSKFNRTDDLLNYLNKDFIIYPKKDMLELSKDYELYYKYDTHLTELGAYIVLQEINQRIYNMKNYLDKNLVYYDYSLKSPSDISRKFYFDNIFKEKFKVKIKKKSLYNNEDRKKKIILIGDSFTEVLGSLLDFDYSLLSVVDIRNINNIEDIIKNKPDILILEIVERHQYSTIDIISKLLKN